MTANASRPMAAPKNSATVLLLRPGAAGLEVLMLKRHASMAIAGGEWVFPGGGCDIGDSSERMLSRVIRPELRVLDALRRSSGFEPCDESVALGLGVTACRETFEESGVLLARHSSGLPCADSLASELQQQRLAQYGSCAFIDMLERHDLVLQLDRLIFWSNWITPSMVPRRFDTRFFLMPMPPGQEAAPDTGESQEARWVGVDWPVGTADLQPPITAPPTLFSMRELAEQFEKLGSRSALLDGARHVSTSPIMLKVVTTENGPLGLLPWDAEYNGAPGVGVACDAAMRARYAGFPQRVGVNVPGKPSGKTAP